MRSGTKGPQVILSRRAPQLIEALFELEVPEIADGLVEIRGVAREPGYRSKIAVESHVQGVDPVGACVGPRGSRVRMVVSELRGEKIDIIPWNTEPARFVAKALSPARVREVYIDDESRDATVVVPDDQLALAIGKEGLNARLAARLTGWKVDIKSDSEFAQEEADAAFAGEDDGDGDFSGRCAALLSNGKRCPNAALPGSKYCGVPAHQAIASDPTAGASVAVAAAVADDVARRRGGGRRGRGGARGRRADAPRRRRRRGGASATPPRSRSRRTSRRPGVAPAEETRDDGVSVAFPSGRASAAAAARPSPSFERFAAVDGVLTRGTDLPGRGALHVRLASRASSRLLDAPRVQAGAAADVTVGPAARPHLHWAVGWLTARTDQTVRSARAAAAREAGAGAS